MGTDTYRYSFSADIVTEDIEAALLLAVWGCEALHGESQTRLDAAHYLDIESRTCVIDGSTPVGRDLNRLFIGFLRREHDEDAFQVEHVTDTSADSGKERQCS